jgi:starch phosphorylase
MFYAPAAQRWDELTGANMARARELSGWKNKLRRQFPQIRIESVQDNMNGVGARVGHDILVEARVDLAGLSPDDVTVELYYGPLDGDGQLNVGQPLPMERVEIVDGGRARYAVQMPCGRSGLTGYTVRVLPRHPLLGDSREMGMVRWV